MSELQISPEYLEAQELLNKAGHGRPLWLPLMRLPSIDVRSRYGGIGPLTSLLKLDVRLRVSMTPFTAKPEVIQKIHDYLQSKAEVIQMVHKLWVGLPPAFKATGKHSRVPLTVKGMDLPPFSVLYVCVLHGRVPPSTLILQVP